MHACMHARPAHAVVAAAAAASAAAAAAAAASRQDVCYNSPLFSVDHMWSRMIAPDRAVQGAMYVSSCPPLTHDKAFRSLLQCLLTAF